MKKSKFGRIDSIFFDKEKFDVHLLMKQELGVVFKNIDDLIVKEFSNRGML